jgi:endogenous inhibitor of DNA gyrase (YacG/DUF329 family)
MNPCPACNRHVRLAERVCPFCTAKIALVALGVGLAACGDKPPPQEPSQVNTPPGTAAPSTATPATPDAGMPRGGEVYGGPPPRK